MFLSTTIPDIKMQILGNTVFVHTHTHTHTHNAIARNIVKLFPFYKGLQKIYLDALTSFPDAKRLFCAHYPSSNYRDGGVCPSVLTPLPSPKERGARTDAEWRRLCLGTISQKRAGLLSSMNLRLLRYARNDGFGAITPRHCKGRCGGHSKGDPKQSRNFVII
jgi:hypothetical protein